MTFLFQNWQVYKDARVLRKDVIRVLKNYPVEERYSLTDQTRRAMLSIILEIAEGSNRKTERDKVVFLTAP